MGKAGASPAATAKAAGAEGRRIFDLQIPLCALDGGATAVWTHDGGFTEIPGLAIHAPFSRG